MKITEFAFNQMRLIYFLFFALVLGGIGSYLMMSKLEDPEVKVKSALVITLYPGASAKEVEQSVTDVIETEIQSMSAVGEVISRSIPNMSQIEIKLKKNAPDDEMLQNWDILRKKVHDLQKKLPDGARESVIYDDFGDVYGLFYAMTADGYSWEEMSDVVKDLRTKLLAIEGVCKVNINGEQKPQIEINISEESISALGIHPIIILTSIKNQLSQIYGGNYQTSGNTLRIAVNNNFHSVEQIRKMIIQYSDKAQIKLKDIATVKRTYADPARDKFKFNNQNALGIAISMESGQNIVEVGKKVEACIASVQKKLPAGVSFNKVYFQSEEVTAALDNFIINLIESVLIVVIIIMFAMGLRSGIIIGSSLLLTIIGTFPFLLLVGGTIQRVSLASFIVAMGMLVDNAIVIVDGIYEDLKSKKERNQALRDTASKTGWPLLGATLIAVVSFLPVFLSPDNTGTYTRDLFLVLCISLILSWLLALTQAPLAAKRMLKLSKKDLKNSDKTPLMAHLVSSALNWTMKHPVFIISCMFILLSVSIWGFKFVKREFFPVLPNRQAYLEYKLPDGTSIKRVEADIAEITNWLLKKPQIESVTTSAGKTPARYNLLRTIAEQNSSYGELIINFKEKKHSDELKNEIESYIRSHYKDAYVRLKKYRLIFTDGLIEVQISGDKISKLKSIAQNIEEIMAKTPLVSKPTIRNNWEAKTPYLYVDYNQYDAKLAHINRSDLGYSLMSATSGFPVARFFEGYKELPVNLKITNNNFGPVEKLNNIPIWGLNALHLPLNDILQGDIPLDQIKEQLLSPSPLSSVADISVKWEEPVIRRYNGIRSIKIQCDPKDGYTATNVVNTIKDEVEGLDLPDGYSLEWKGEMGDQSSALKYIVMFLPISLIAIVLLLLWLYHSYRKMIITFICLMLAFIGIVPALVISGVGFGFTAIVGVIGLMGMMIKNAVVLIDEIDRQLSYGVNLKNAIVQASMLRVRSVVMASLTTILGMMPLMSDAFFGSMAITIMSGLLVGTGITLIILPLLYSLFFKERK